MKRQIVVLAAVLALLALGAADCEPEKGGSTQRQPNPPAAGQQPKAGNGAQQPAPVQGDPSAHNTQPGEVDLHVEWGSENRKTPACEWSINAPGHGHVCENMERPEQVDGKGDYLGLWEYETTGKAGDVVWLSAQGNIGNKWINCSVAWKGKYHPLPSSGNRCGGTFTLN